MKNSADSRRNVGRSITNNGNILVDNSGPQLVPTVAIRSS